MIQSYKLPHYSDCVYATVCGKATTSLYTFKFPRVLNCSSYLVSLHLVRHFFNIKAYYNDIFKLMIRIILFYKQLNYFNSYFELYIMDVK